MIVSGPLPLNVAQGSSFDVLETGRNLHLPSKLRPCQFTLCILRFVFAASKKVLVFPVRILVFYTTKSFDVFNHKGSTVNTSAGETHIKGKGLCVWRGVAGRGGVYIRNCFDYPPTISWILSSVDVIHGAVCHQWLDCYRWMFLPLIQNPVWRIMSWVCIPLGELEQFLISFTYFWVLLTVTLIYGCTEGFGNALWVPLQLVIVWMRVSAIERIFTHRVQCKFLISQAFIRMIFCQIDLTSARWFVRPCKLKIKDKLAGIRLSHFESELYGFFS